MYTAVLFLTAAMTLYLAYCLDFPRNFIYIGQLYLSCNLADNHSTYLLPNLPCIAEHTHWQFHTVSKMLYVEIDCKPMIVHYSRGSRVVIDLLSIKWQARGRKNVQCGERRNRKNSTSRCFQGLILTLHNLSEQKTRHLVAFAERKRTALAGKNK